MALLPPVRIVAIVGKRDAPLHVKTLLHSQHPTFGAFGLLWSHLDAQKDRDEISWNNRHDKCRS
jgi:hypothetical protein